MRFNCVLPSLLAATLTGMAMASSAPNVLQPSERVAGWSLLFDGKTLDGWRASDAPGTFRVADGRIIVHGPRSHLYYVGPVQQHDFRNFELQLEVLTFPGSNSGIYFHTEWQPEDWPRKGYEVQINNSHTDPSRTGGLWGIQDNRRAPAADGEWFTVRVRVQGKRILVTVNDRVVSDYTEEAAPQRSAELRGRLLGSGTFALQGHDPESEVHYRSIKIRPLP